ncbi:MAG: hypothetical protein EP329_03110 [Deltaproteobacteria bacterium]|nr:MAG: hypothetical protein EP329_03110 [Deltaproteobacteria bacterium]
MSRMTLTLVLLCGLATACNPVYAPPLRSLDYGAPGRLEPGRAEVGTGVSLYLTNSVLAGFSLLDGLSLEVAFDWVPAAVGDSRDAWAMGSVGLRYELTGAAGSTRTGWRADVEVGAGGGVGGADQSERSWWDIPARGGYVGLGVGHRHGRWTLYARGRCQVVAADRIPMTVWWTAKLGAEWSSRSAFVALGFGGAGYSNRDDSEQGVLAELLIGGKFGL